MSSPNESKRLNSLEISVQSHDSVQLHMFEQRRTWGFYCDSCERFFDLVTDGYVTTYTDGTYKRFHACGFPCRYISHNYRNPYGSQYAALPPSVPVQRVGNRANRPSPTSPLNCLGLRLPHGGRQIGERVLRTMVEAPLAKGSAHAYGRLKAPRRIRLGEHFTKSRFHPAGMRVPSPSPSDPQKRCNYAEPPSTLG